MAKAAIISCKNGHQLRVPGDKGALAVTCPRCKDTFEWSPSRMEDSRNGIRDFRSPITQKARASMSGDQLLDAREAMSILGIDNSELRNLVSRGDLRAFRSDGTTKFRRDDLMSIDAGKKPEPAVAISAPQKKARRTGKVPPTVQRNNSPRVISRNVPTFHPAGSNTARTPHKHTPPPSQFAEGARWTGGSSSAVNGEAPSGIHHLRPPIPENVQLAIDARSSSPDALARDAVRDAVGIDDHLEFGLSIFKKYEWEEAATQEVVALLNEVQFRRNDPRLFLGAVGEFSSGKSTLINALLRDNFLHSDVLSETTSAATIISHGASLDAEVLFLDGQRKSFSRDSGAVRNRRAPAQTANELVEFIHRYSAEEQHARQVAALNVLHPSQALLNGLVIVDTPGTNVDNQRHAEVVAQALKHICDAAIVVIPSDIPCSQTLVAFLKSHLSGVLHRCVFVLTKIDTIRRPAERERLIATVKSIIKRETGCQNPLVLPAAPLLVVDDLNEQSGAGEHSNGDGQALLDQFETTERALYRFLADNKEFILIERLVECLTVLLDTLTRQLGSQEIACRQYHDELARNQIPDLVSFGLQQMEQHTSELVAGAAEVFRQLPSEVEQCRERILQAIHCDIGYADSTEALNRVVEHNMKYHMTTAQTNLQNSLRSLIKTIAVIAARQHEQFREEFLRIYNSLTALDGSIADAHDTVRQDLPLLDQGNSGIQALLQHLKKESDQSDGNTGGGVLGGAAIGTFILPGIGTVLGAIAGGFFGALFGPSLDELKAKATKELDESIHKSFADCESNAQAILHGTLEKAIESQNKIIDGYFQVYGRKVDELIAAESQMMEELARYRQAVQGDLVELNVRHGRLIAARERLRSR